MLIVNSIVANLFFSLLHLNSDSINEPDKTNNVTNKAHLKKSHSKEKLVLGKFKSHHSKTDNPVSECASLLPIYDCLRPGKIVHW